MASPQFPNFFLLQANSGAVTIGKDGVASFTNCVFDGNSGSAGGAILAYDGTTLNINRCTVNANSVRRGLSCWGERGPRAWDSLEQPSRTTPAGA